MELIIPLRINTEYGYVRNVYISLPIMKSEMTTIKDGDTHVNLIHVEKARGVNLILSLIYLV